MADFEWPVIVAPTVSVWADASSDRRLVAAEAAADILRVLSGGVFGVFTSTVRPIVSCGGGSTYLGSSGHPGQGFVSGFINTGDLFGSSCGCGTGSCETGSSEVGLDGPIVEIVHVWVDGVELDGAAYKVRDGSHLLRVDGEQWPSCQNLDVGDLEVGAFTVEYRHGVVVPAAGQIAAGDLAVEWLKAASGEACGLPPRTSQVARQGVTIDLDPRAYFDAGLTGIDRVDQWIMTVNPNGLRSQPLVYSPDVPSPVRFS